MIEKLKQMRVWKICLLLGIVQVVFMLMSLKVGYISLSWQDLWTFFTQNTQVSSTISTEEIYQVLEMRIPRVLLAVCVGMGLTLSGIIMQAIVQNPLADPYVLGISSGAYLGTAIGIFIGVVDIWGVNAIGLSAFLGAILVSAIVIPFSSSSSGNRIENLLLGGMALGLLCSALSGFLIYKGDDRGGMESISFWMMGSIANAPFEGVIVLFTLILIVFAYFLTQIRVLDVFLLGEDTAITLGIDIKLYIPQYLLLNGIVVGFLVAHAGMIGFVGLLIPHIVRSLFGTSHRVLLPVAVMIGGIVTVLLDVLSRTLISGVDIPLGALFAILGVPLFVYIIFKRSYNFYGA